MPSHGSEIARDVAVQTNPVPVEERGEWSALYSSLRPAALGKVASLSVHGRPDLSQGDNNSMDCRGLATVKRVRCVAAAQAGPGGPRRSFHCGEAQQRPG